MIAAAGVGWWAEQEASAASAMFATRLTITARAWIGAGPDGRLLLAVRRFVAGRLAIAGLLVVLGGGRTLVGLATQRGRMLRGRTARDGGHRRRRRRHDPLLVGEHQVAEAIQRVEVAHHRRRPAGRLLRLA